MTHPKVERSKEILRAHAETLRGQIDDLKAMVHPISKEAGALDPPEIEAYELIADAIERYLRGEAKSMDHALGLVAPVGAPGSKGGQLGKHFELAIDVAWRRWAGHSWVKICEDLNDRFEDGLDERSLQKIYDREKTAVERWYAEQVSKKLDDNDPHGANSA